MALKKFLILRKLRSSRLEELALAKAGDAQTLIQQNRRFPDSLASGGPGPSFVRLPLFMPEPAPGESRGGQALRAPELLH
jgi:hypothetical protein